MVELDLPTLQIQRYVELLKRRRWQLIPFAIVGLLVGGVVAALIPRYYEAKTQLRVFGTVALDDSSSGDDGFTQRMENASAIIRSPTFLKQAMEELGWPEVFADNESSRDALSEAAERVRVRDVNPRPRRDSAILEISYRDRVAKRAEDLANKLFEFYRQREWAGLSARVEAQLNKANEEKNAAVRAFGEISVQVSTFEKVHNIIWVRTETGGLKDTLTFQAESLAGVSKEIRDLRSKLAGLAAKLAELNAAFAGIPEFMPISVETLPPALAPVYLQAVLNLESAKLKAGMVSPLNENHLIYQLDVKRFEDVLEQIKELALKVSGGKQRDPAYAALVSQRRSIEAEREEIKGVLAALEKEEILLEAQVAKIPDIQQRQRILVADKEAAEKKREMLDDVYEKQLIAWNKLNVTRDTFIQVLYPAYAPRTPNYPNIWVVSSAGCLIGLFTAVGLVFILDFFRSAFKTVDDAVRGLPLPVLGFVSHMETVEEQQVLRRRRVGWSAAAAALVLLTASVVVLYNVDKTRLPVFVARVLDSVLGSGNR